MRWTTTCIMLVVAGAMVALAWWIHESDPDRRRRIEVVPMVSSAELPRDEVDRIELRIEQEQPLVFQREDGDWWMTSPFRHAAEYSSMLALIEAAISTRIVDRLEAVDEEDLARLSLLPPRGRVVYSAGDRVVELDLGQSGLGGRAYARRDGGEDVLVVDDALSVKIFNDNPVMWRERSLFPGVDIEVDRIVRSVEDNEVVFERSGGAWAITSPISTRVDSEAMGTHAIDLARATWSNVLLDQPEDLAAFGLDPAVARLAIERDGESMVLLIGERLGSAGQDRAAMIEGVPVVLSLDGRTVASLLPDPVTLVDHRASRVRPADVKTIEIERPSGTFLIQRALENWIAPQFDDAVVPPDRVEELLQSVTTLRATEVELRDTYPSELEQARVTLLGFDGAPLDTVRLLREEPDSGRWAMENGDNVLRVHPDFLVLHLRPVDYGLAAPPEETP